MDIGKRIAQIRKERGISQDTLSELATLSRITVARYESGKYEPGAIALSRIADALDVTTDCLLGRSEGIPGKGEQPKTLEARAIASGVDKLPKGQREQAVNVLKAVFNEQPDLFKL